MPLQFEGKVALVTGGASGIGRATALAFAREGARVMIDDINIDGGEDTVRMIKEAGGEAVFVKADGRKATEVEALIRKVVEVYGRLDCAHNNAGITGERAYTSDCTEENWDDVVNTDLKGVWLCMKYEIPQMLKQGGGAIVNTSSMRGLTGNQGRIAYAASKHGVVGITRTAALEYATAGIRVNAVCPGVILTPLNKDRISGDPEFEARLIGITPLRRMGTAEEIAETVVWLCSERASFVTGHAMSVDGGATAH
jgi:NAD(P)-dependent dehydrogenase (short-subunit alcohol dehydrogenase family)